MAVRTAFSTELLKFAGNVASTANVDADVDVILKEIPENTNDKDHSHNHRIDNRKSVGKGLLDLLGNITSAVDIDVHIDVQRIKCSCTSPSGYPTRVTATDNHNGTFALEMNVTEGGVYKCDVTTDDNPIKGSPFFINIRQTGEKEKVKITGVGLSSVLMSGVVGIFQIDTRSAGPGKLEVQIDGPKGGFHVVMSRDPTDERIVRVDYNPELEGVYNINVLWDGYHVPGSPRLIFIAPNEMLLDRWMENPSLMLKDEEVNQDNSSNG